MKLLVFLCICTCISQSVTVSTEVKTKMPPKSNLIPLQQKQNEIFYQQPNQQTQTDFLPVQIMQKPIFLAHPPQHVQHVQPQPTMLIIAQPAYVPQNVLYGGNPGGMQQQLLNYFHSNPQAKYQLLYGGYQPQPAPQPYMPHHHHHHHPLAAQTVAAYQVVPNPVYNGYNHLQVAPPQMNYHQPAPLQQHQMGSQYVQPMQLSQIAHLAQLAAQQFQSPVRSVPPIITGFENFTPEQQAQIKTQLAQHLGTAITTAPTSTTASNQYTSQVAVQPTQSMSSHDFMQQSQDKNAPQASGSTFSPSLVYRAQYTKG